MKQRRFLIPLVVGALWAVGLSCHDAIAQTTPKIVKTIKHWTTYSYQEEETKICFVASQPTKSEGKYKRRGQVVFMVTHRINGDKKTVGEVSFAAGYTFPKDGKVSVVIDGKKTFELGLTKDGTAWATSPDVDEQIVAAMKKGTTMVLKSQSERGTKTTDTFSLSGITAALNLASKTCGV